MSSKSRHANVLCIEQLVILLIWPARCRQASYARHRCLRRARHARTSSYRNQGRERRRRQSCLAWVSAITQYPTPKRTELIPAFASSLKSAAVMYVFRCSTIAAATASVLFCACNNSNQVDAWSCECVAGIARSSKLLASSTD